MILCDYGCNQIATTKFKNGKFCCSKTFFLCDGYKQKLSLIRKGKISSHKGKNRNYSKESRKKMGDFRRGKKVWNSGLKNCFNEITIKKIKDSHIGKSFITENGRNKIKKQMLNGGSLKAIQSKKYGPMTENIKKKISQSKIGIKCSDKCKYVNRIRLLNGQALKMIRNIKKISNEEIKLRNMVKKLYPNCEFQHPVFNYALDIAILEHKIAIEYDGYFHFHNREKINYYQNRQQKIELEGWKFLRYTIFDRFPSFEKVKIDIKILIGEN